jgi:hypothetical protein
MFCPNCGTETRDPLKFCKQCGVNLRRVQGVLGKGGAGAATNSPVNWQQVALEEHQEERDGKKRKTPEEKRYEEIKGGVITASIGLGLMIFLRFLFNAIASTLPWEEANVLRGLWWVGWIPFLIGLSVIFNGYFISRRIVELKRQQEPANPQPQFSAVPGTSHVPLLTEASQSPISEYSVTEPTTTRLREPVPVSSPRDTN